MQIMRRWIGVNWREFARTILASFGVVFLPIEAFEVLTDGNVKVSLGFFILLVTVPGLIFFFVDGYYISGFLRREVVIPVHGLDTKIRVKFGDVFAEQGWKAIAVNDFFDNIVDGDVVSTNSMHGIVLNTYWGNNREDWKKQIDAWLVGKNNNKENRPKGNRLRYPIGTTARAETNNEKFLFVALTKTNTENNVTTATAEMLIKAIRGLASEARAACSMEPLIIPLMGSGLARIGIKSSVLIDLIVTAVVEESRQGMITREVNIVLPLDKAHDFNLKNNFRNWAHGQ